MGIYLNWVQEAYDISKKISPEWPEMKKLFPATGAKKRLLPAGSDH